MAEKVWMVQVETWELRLMYRVDATEAVRLGDYAYAPMGGAEPPLPTPQPAWRPQEEVA